MLSSILQEIPQLKVNLPSNTLSFQKGKIFFGTVKNFFPNDIALLQIGDQKLIAKLEIALTSGDGYWFQVDSNQGEVRLKVISKQNHKDNDVSMLLKNLSLPATKENKALIRFLSEQQIPLAKESISKMSEWVSKQPNLKDTLNIVKLMLQKEFPISESVFKSLLSSEKTEGIHDQINMLEGLLKKEKPTAVVQAIQSTINKMNSKNEELHSIQLIQSLIDYTKSRNTEKQTLSHSILQKLGLKEESVVAPNPHNQTEPIPLIKQGQHHEMEQDSFRQIPQKVITLTSKVIENQILRETPNQLVRLTKSEQGFLHELYDTLKKSYTRQEALQQFKEVTKTLGLFYEGQLKQDMESTQTGEALKPLLVKYLQESDQGSPAYDVADNLVHKMNGQQIHSNENGPFQQLFLDIPIQLFGFKTNLTMQWSGKKNEDGKIDANYCQILFYLDLEHMGQTIVEMKVQNRVITVNVYNDSSSLGNISNGLVSSLKNGLNELDYQLSDVHFFERQSRLDSKNTINKTVKNQSYKGVDIRI